MTSISSTQSGTFKIGGDIQINRLGFGAMRITDAIVIVTII
jgi:hypothetical protein